MEELNKKYINNKIVGMRKHVKQSRVHTINKLIKNIKKLRTRKGTKEEKAKNEKKAAKYLEEVQIMKKIKDDEVSKYALTNDKCLQEVTNDLNEFARVKALARIASHKAIAKEVTELRTSFPNWKDTLPILMETLGEKQRLKKKMINPVTRREVELSAPQEKKSISLTAVQNPCKNKETKSIVNGEIEKALVKDSSENSSENCDYNDNAKSVNNFSGQLTKNGSPQKVNTNKIGKLASVINNEVINTVTKKDNQCVDDFFLMTDDKEYISVSRGNENDPSDTTFDKFTINEISLQEDNHSRKRIRKENKRKIEIYPKFEDNKIEQQIHPSWQAKKKLQIIKEFEGKKIKFST